METEHQVAAARLSDRELLRQVAGLARQERAATVELIAHLAELDRRKLYRGEGFRSLFTYCTGALRLAEHAACKRMVAARACRRFPAVLERLADGSLNLSSVKLLAPHFTPQNLAALIAEATGRSKREVEKIVARLAPQPETPASIRKLPSAPVLACVPAPAAVSLTVSASCRGEEDSRLDQAAVPTAEPQIAVVRTPPLAAATPPVKPGETTPVAPDRYRFQFTAGGDAYEMFLQVQALLRREIPDGDPAAIFARALKLLLEETARKKVAAVKHPRPRNAGHDPRSRHIPAELVRAVWRRDDGRCAFMGRNGHRCGERAFIEFHHLDAYALGGETTEQNISLRCRVHNQYEAELVFGPFDPKVAKVREARATYDATNGPRCGEGRYGMRSTGPGASSGIEIADFRPPVRSRGKEGARCHFVGCPQFSLQDMKAGRDAVIRKRDVGHTS